MNTFIKVILAGIALGVVENLILSASDAARPKPEPVKE